MNYHIRTGSSRLRIVGNFLSLRWGLGSGFFPPADISYLLAQLGAEVRLECNASTVVVVIYYTGRNNGNEINYFEH